MTARDDDRRAGIEATLRKVLRHVREGRDALRPVSKDG